MVQPSSTTQINWGTYNTVLSLTLTNIGLYDLYATMTLEWYTGSSATNQIKYSISTSTTAPDANSYGSGFATPYFIVATNGSDGLKFLKVKVWQLLKKFWRFWNQQLSIKIAWDDAVYIDQEPHYLRSKIKESIYINALDASEKHTQILNLEKGVKQTPAGTSLTVKFGNH